MKDSFKFGKTWKEALTNAKNGPKFMTIEESLEIVAVAWCKKKTENKVMDSDLAEEFAKILCKEVNKERLKNDAMVVYKLQRPTSHKIKKIADPEFYQLLEGVKENPDGSYDLSQVMNRL